MTKFGVYLGNYGPYADPGFMVEVAVAASDAGWDGVFLYDHLDLGGIPTIDPWTTTGAMAARAPGLSLGVLLTVPARRRLHTLALQAATVQHLLLQPLIVGLGLGSDRDFTLFDEDAALDRRAAQLELAIDVLPRFWRGETLEGTYRATSGPNETGAVAEVTYGGARLGPMLTTQPELWIGATYTSRAAQRRASRVDGVFPIRRPWTYERLLEPDELASFLNGIAPPVPISATTAMSEPSTAADRASAFAGLGWWLELMDPAAREPEAVLTRVMAGP